MNAKPFFKSIAAVTAMAVFITGCSGGSSTPTKSTPATGNTSGGTGVQASAAPIVDPTTTTTGTTESQDDILTNLKAIRDKQDTQDKAIASASKNSKSASSSSSWAKWLGIGIAAALLIGMVRKGYETRKSQRDLSKAKTDQYISEGMSPEEAKSKAEKEEMSWFRTALGSLPFSSEAEKNYSEANRRRVETSTKATVSASENTVRGDISNLGSSLDAKLDVTQKYALYSAILSATAAIDSESVAAEVEAQNGKLDAQATKSDDIVRSLDILGTKIKELKVQADSNSSNITTLSGKLTGAETALKQVQTQIAGYDTTVQTKLAPAVNSLMSEVNAAKASLAQRTTSMEAATRAAEQERSSAIDAQKRAQAEAAASATSKSVADKQVADAQAGKKAADDNAAKQIELQKKIDDAKTYVTGLIASKDVDAKAKGDEKINAVKAEVQSASIDSSLKSSFLNQLDSIPH